jgi:aldehyde:ferredoxin oxidoreductase
VLNVDLAAGAQSERPVGDADLAGFVGGSGLAAKILLDDFPVDVPPLGPDNPLLVMNGPLQGLPFPGASRFAVCARSPLTGIWGEGTCGGTFGPRLRQAGFGGLVLRGRAPAPTVVRIEDGKVELRDAAHLRGLDTYETIDRLVADAGGDRSVSVLAIGPAGENGVRFAGICNDKGDFVGRTGMGAVMGSKNVKALVCRGKGAIAAPRPEAFETLRKAALARMREAVPAQSLREMGTDASMDLGMMTGDVPIRNWSVGEDLALSAALGGPALASTYLVRNHACTYCPIACKRVVAVKEGPYRTAEGPGPEYETCCTFGTMLGNGDLAAVCKANEVCNRLGLDTISCGATIAFAMDLFERGLLTSAEVGGRGLRWGDMDAVFALLPEIAHRRGFGDVLAQGSREAARRIGRGAEDAAVEVKGLEVPMHDPRGYHGMGLAYMVGTRGACHLQHLVHPIEQGITTYTDAGLEENYEGRTSEGKARMVFLAENLGVPCNALAICEFNAWCLTAGELAGVLGAAVGRDVPVAELMAAGARIWMAKRVIDVLLGVRARDDRLPRRILTALPDGGAAGSVPDEARMRAEYYALRGLDADGIPTPAGLRAVGLEALEPRVRGLRGG